MGRRWFSMGGRITLRSRTTLRQSLLLHDCSAPHRSHDIYRAATFENGSVLRTKANVRLKRQIADRWRGLGETRGHYAEVEREAMKGSLYAVGK